MASARLLVGISTTISRSSLAADRLLPSLAADRPLRSRGLVWAARRSTAVRHAVQHSPQCRVLPRRSSVSAVLTVVGTKLTPQTPSSPVVFSTLGFSVPLFQDRMGIFLFACFPQCSHQGLWAAGI